MAIPVGVVGGVGQSGAAAGTKETFGKALEQAKQPKPGAGQVTGEVAPHPVKQVQGAQMAKGAPPAKADAKVVAAKAVDQVAEAQKRLDRILALAESGKTFTPAELIALQAQVAQASQALDLAGKVVDKAVNGVKQILQTQV
jgi:hypothetical protein